MIMKGANGNKAAKATAFYNKATIAGKIFQILSSNGVTSENKTIHTLPPSTLFKERMFSVSCR